MYNTLTNAIYDGEGGLNVVPCYVTTKYAEFVTRENGGGFVQELDASDPVIRQTTKDGTMDMLPSGNQLVKADEYYCLIVDDEGGWEPAVVDMKVTAMKVSKRWKTQVAMNKAKNPKTGQMQILPIFSTIWKLTTVDETNKRNETYSNYSVSKVGVIKDSTLYQEARAFRQSIAAGEVKASEGQQSEKPAAPVGDDEIPF
jgi:hypothetical protein